MFKVTSINNKSLKRSVKSKMYEFNTTTNI